MNESKPTKNKKDQYDYTYVTIYVIPAQKQGNSSLPKLRDFLPKVKWGMWKSPGGGDSDHNLSNSGSMGLIIAFQVYIKFQPKCSYV